MSTIKVISVFVVASWVLFGNHVQAQIPVTDDASIAMATAKWKAQYDQMAAQIETMKQQFQSLTGSRGLGQIMNNPDLRDYLPSDWQAVYDAVKKEGYAGLSGRAETIYSQSKIFDSCAHLTVTDQKMLCEARAVKAAQDQAFALDAYDKAKSRLNQIDALMSQINATTDPKAIAELQSRIATEQAMIQNEQTKLQLYAMVAEAEDRIQQQQQREIQARIWASRKGIKATPPTFGEAPGY